MNWCERQRRLLGRTRIYDARDEVTKTFTLTASKDFIARLERHLAFIQYLGSVGHSCIAGISVDGDGSDRLKVAEDLPTIKEPEVKTHGTYPDQWESAGVGK